MQKYLKHLKIILKHKYYVGIECCKLGLYWQGITHDLSKFSFTEFFTSARYFQGNRSPIEAEKDDKGYSIAWLNHKAKNKHHWIYWTDVCKGEFIAVEMPLKYVKEMLCDFIGAGKAYNKGKWNKSMPYDYYVNVERKKMILHPKTKELFEKMLIDLKNK